MNDDVIVKSLSLPLITTLSCTCKTFRANLRSVKQDLMGNISIYTWSRACTMYVTIWGNGLFHLKQEVELPEEVCRYFDDYNNNFRMNFALDECDSEAEEFLDTIADYYYKLDFLTDYGSVEHPQFMKRFTHIIGKESKEEQRIECPRIVFDKF